MSLACRRTSLPCRVGGVVGERGAPVVGQSMTNSDTADGAVTARSTDIGISLPGAGGQPHAGVAGAAAG